MATEINTDINEEINNRVDDLAAEQAPKSTFKLKVPQATGDVVEQVAKQQADLVEAIITSKAGIKIPIAELKNLKVKGNTLLDFSSMTEDDVYNLDIPMNARPFSSEDSLKVSLKDTNYVARWVNKDNRRLGTMLGRGFSYVVKEDLSSDLELEVYQDASGHYVLGDVICMKIQKEKYYQALRAAHLRAMNAINPKGAHKAAIQNATQFLDKETGGQYTAEHEARKVDVYAPDFRI